MQRKAFALKQLCGAVTVFAATSCAHRRETAQPPADMRGLYRVDFETNRFQPCADSGRLGYRVRADSARWTQRGRPQGAATPSGTIYYVRWVADVLPDTAPPPPPGSVRIGGGPTVRVRDILEMRPPRDGECGWHPSNQRR